MRQVREENDHLKTILEDRLGLQQDEDKKVDIILVFAFLRAQYATQVVCAFIAKIHESTDPAVRYLSFFFPSFTLLQTRILGGSLLQVPKI
jgi:hypothetical protein